MGCSGVLLVEGVERTSVDMSEEGPPFVMDSPQNRVLSRSAEHRELHEAVFGDYIHLQKLPAE
ncbi:MAG: hypothetical protein GY696_32370 [Gammaproteobacteria bacterium]|nr:hypothetical protein [Gammaproteobacteria bacterium]